MLIMFQPCFTFCAWLIIRFKKKKTLERPLCHRSVLWNKLVSLITKIDIANKDEDIKTMSYSRHNAMREMGDKIKKFACPIIIT